MSNTIKRLLSAVIAILLISSSYAQVDTEFWFAAPHICEHSRVTGGYHMVLFSYDKPAHIELSMPANSAFVTKTYDLNAYDYVDIEMAQDYDDAVANLEVPFDVVSQRGIHITSTSKIGGYYNHTGNNAEAYSLKNEALGTNFGVVSQTVFQIQSDSETYEDAYSSAQIVATEDNTIVTITPVTGHPVSPNCNATPIVVHLNRGETYAVRSCSKDPLYGVNGMRISSNKPIAVCSTDDSTQAGTGAAGLDLTGEQLVSLDFAGRRYTAIGQQNSWNSCSITALENGTTVTLSTGQVLNMQKDETQNISMATVPALYIESNKDVLVYQITGEDDEAAGTMLPALDCTGSRYVAYKRMPDSYMTFLNIVTKSSNINSIYINNSKVASSQFHPVPGTGNAWYYASIQKSGTDDFLTVECKSGFIQLGVLDMKGTSLTDLKSCTYGYFSDYGTAHEYDEYALFDAGGIYTWPNHYRTDGITPQTFTDEGIYKDTLTDNNGCDSICVLHLSKIPYPDNVDDVTGCMVPPSTNVWSIRQSAISNGVRVDYSAVPLSGDIDDDGEIDIVVPINESSNFISQLGIFDVNANLKSILDIASCTEFTVPAIAKIQVSEGVFQTLIFIFAFDRYLYAYSIDGLEVWKSNMPFSSHGTEAVTLPSLSLADFNHDGWTEIYVGPEIFDAATGVRLCKYSGNKGNSDRLWKTSRQSYQSVAADVIGDDRLELILGNTACSVNINSRTDESRNSITTANSVSAAKMKMEDNSNIPSTDGHTLLADMDGDGKLDVVVMHIDKTSRVIYVYVWNPRTGSMISTKKITNAAEFGAPNIGDIDNDGSLELNFIIGTYSGETTDANDRIYSLKYNKATQKLEVFWTLHHDDASGSTGLSLFDFNQDGTMEIVYRDCEHLRIINGSKIHHITGNPVAAPYDLATIPCTSGTAMEYPIIADIDADGEAEIVTVGNGSRLMVFKSNLAPWAPARSVWNQFAYNITNINEDLTIPTYLYNNAHIFTDVSSTTRQPFNNFLSQVTTINTQGVPFIAAADVNISTSTTTTYENDSIKIDLSFCNQGDLQVNAPYCITAYKNAYRGSVLFVDTIKAILPIGDCLSHQVGFPISNVCSDKDINSIVIAVNDDGHGIAQHGNQQAECDTTNNSTSVSLPTDFRSDTTKYTPVICATELPYTFSPTGTIFPVGTTSGRTIISKTNKYGCDSIITIDLTINPILYGDTFAVVYHANTYEWYGETFTTEGNYPHTLSSKVTGCDSIVTLHLTFVPYPDNVADVECVVPPMPSNFEMKELFKTDGVHSMTTPMVADLDGDGQSEIICCKWPDEAKIFLSDGFLVINGQTGDVIDTILTCQYPICGQPITIADVNGDGRCEIFLSDIDNYVYCYDYQGNLLWNTTFALDGTYIPLLGNLTDDNIPELLFGKYIFNPITGTLIHEILFSSDGTGWGAPHGVGVAHRNYDPRAYHLGALSDVDHDGNLEYCAGNTIYKLNITNPNGQVGNSSSIYKQAESIASVHNYDGQTVVVDFDNDGIQDICVLGLPKDLAMTSPQPEYDIYVWNSQTAQIVAHDEFLGVGKETSDGTWTGQSIPYCGDLNGDGDVDLTFSAKGLAMYTYTYDGSQPNGLRKIHEYAPFSETCGYTVFDFNMDGKSEIVYRGTHTLNIVDGSTLTPLSTPIEAFSGTVTEYPVVADVNKDGQAEIIICRGHIEWKSGIDRKEGIRGWVSVYGAMNSGAWSSARSVWNQWAYNSININDDMSVPRYMYDVSIVYPNGTRPFNSFLAQKPIIDKQGDIFVPAADAAVSTCSQSVVNDSVVITLKYCNNGDANLVAPYEITTYQNEYRGTVVQVDTIKEGLAINECKTITIKVPSLSVCKAALDTAFIIAVNDDGHGIAQHGNQQAECDTTNNTYKILLPNDLRRDTAYLNVTISQGESYIFDGHTYATDTQDTATFVSAAGCDSVCVLDLKVIPYPDNVDDATGCMVPPSTNVWSIRQKAISGVSNIDDCGTTICGDIDGDGQIEILAPIITDDVKFSKIGILNSQAKAKRIIDVPTCSAFINIAIAKVKVSDSDYKTLIFFLAYDRYLYAYDPNGSQFWKSDQQFTSHSGEAVAIASLSLADFNHDGWTEIYIGPEIFDAATGKRLAKYNGNKGHSDRAWKASRQSYQSVVADVVGDDRLELILGNTACSVNINSRTNETLNSIMVFNSVPAANMKMEDNSNIPSTDGHTLLADMDGDGKLDVVVMHIDKTNRIIYIYVWNPRTGSMICTKKITNAAEFGTPNVGDIDHDGNLELNFIIGTYSGETTDANDKIYSLKYNKSTHNLEVFWTLHHDDASGSTGLSLFDFNQDGTMEIVYRDCEHLRIINGSKIHHLTGLPVAAPYDLANIPCTSGTGVEYPVIADVDADGEAEIVVVGNGSKLVIYESDLAPWAPARSVWNQFAYNITNVNEDLTIPTYLYNNAHIFTDVSSTTRQPFNNFLAQTTTINTQGVPFIAAADVNVSTTTTATYENDSVKIDISFCNQGDLQVNAPYCITVYKNAYRGSVLFVDTIKAILPIGDCLSHQVGFPISEVCSDKDINTIVIAVNDDGHGIAQHGNQQAECDTTNNRTSVSPPTDFRCDTTKYTPVICATELPYTFSPTGTIFPVGTTSGRTIISKTNKYGCDSIITIDLTVNPTLTGDTTATFCNGTSFIWHGTSYPTGGDYPYTYTSKVTGCDSIVTLHLTQLEPTDSVEVVTICAGGSHTWHGHTYTTSITTTETIDNAVGCDSVCTLKLTVLPALTGDTNMIVCDTLLPVTWRGQSITGAGEYYHTATAKNGCDSTITLHVTIETCLPPIPPTPSCDTLEATILVPDICADDDSMYIDITYTKGLPVSYNVTFGADAVAQGFQSSYSGNVRITSSTTASISIPIPNDPTNRQVYPKPNVYSIDISILDTCDAYTTWRSQNFLIHYPSWLTLQRWNDVISLYNERYNGGYVFSQIRWFHEGTLLESRGDHDGYIYQRPTLVYGDAYWAELTRADDGVAITTCPIYPVPMTDSTKMDDVTDPYIIVTPTVVTPSNPTVTVKTNICGEYYVYYVDGHLLDKQNFCPKDNHTFTIDIDPCYVRTGLYILVFYGEEGTIKAVKLLVEP